MLPIRFTHHVSRFIWPGKIVNVTNQEHWEQRYQSGDMHWDKGAPSPGLVDFLAAHPALPRGAVCVPGCGTGHDVRELAKAVSRRLGSTSRRVRFVSLCRKRGPADSRPGFGVPISCRMIRRNCLIGFLNIRSSAQSNPMNETIMSARCCAGSGWRDNIGRSII